MTTLKKRKKGLDASAQNIASILRRASLIRSDSPYAICESAYKTQFRVSVSVFKILPLEMASGAFLRQGRVGCKYVKKQHQVVIREKGDFRRKPFYWWPATVMYVVPTIVGETGWNNGKKTGCNYRPVTIRRPLPSRRTFRVQP